ncbi:TetR/AcrR family transcriptional regulator [Streptomyces sp. FH025]|uniref:TetR/AcrR family transcriptional regulator n=1 Tax=Streptomyces sp. FH025 TaxID=2815937 RepID=UPI001A9F07DE|nr:TetR family transcriptional regulator [Streptomyces sp. FH025]MBO1418307.1 TetR/AcrR family transcriptional regulator [Streptomyces sp. FH025]
MATRARERLLATADELFYAEGVRAVGVERLLEVSGVGRASFYRHFPSKEELVLAVLRGRDERSRAWLEQAVAARGGTPLAIFDALAERFTSPEFSGCAFINAMIEDPDLDGPVCRLVIEHKRAVTEYIAGLLTAAGHPDPEQLAQQFLMLMDGAHVTALRTRSAAPALQAKAIAEMLLAGRA